MTEESVAENFVTLSSVLTLTGFLEETDLISIFTEYRMRLGLVKLENFIFVYLCSRLSLYL